MPAKRSRLLQRDDAADSLALPTAAFATAIGAIKQILIMITDA
ncbi:hypothetical protein [Kaistia soli]|nr:hypothetical protein [Kaistia soli]